MNLAHVIELEPTVKQVNALARAAGCSRFTFNWALAEWNRQYRDGDKPSANALKKKFNAIKKTEFPWICDSPRDANSQAFADLNVAFRNFFSSLKGKRSGQKMGRPKFKKKGQKDSFYVANDRFHFDEDRLRVYLPVIGWVKITERLRFDGKILNGRVKRVADRWYLSVQVEVEARVPTTPLRSIVGVDLGIKTAVVPSRGKPAEAPKPLKAALKQLSRANRRLHRRKKGGKNRDKARKRVARIHQRITTVRKDFMHKITTQLCRENQAVVVEDLHVAGMLRNRRLSRALVDVGLGMFKPMMLYKGVKFGCEITVADRFFPSSKRCHACGNVKDVLSLGQREYVCDACGLVEDRDKNAALNLEMYPRLEGNWRKPTPGDDLASTRRANGLRASRVADPGTNPCPPLDTL
jgi:putative transposase